MNGKNFLNFMDKRILVISIFIGAAFVGFTTGNVIAQEIKIGDTTGTPFVSFEDAMASGMYEIRLNDGTGEFQIWDMTNSRSVLITDSSGNIGVGDSALTSNDFVIGCKSGKCNIQTLASDGAAQNTVYSLGGDGDAIIRVRDDVTDAGPIAFDLRSRSDGTVCLGDPFGEKCMLIFDIAGPNPGQVKETDGTCIANC